MAHVCPKPEEIEKRRANLTAIADVVNELIKEYDNVYCEPVAVPVCCHSQQSNGVGEPPNVMICYKVGKFKNSGTKAKKSTKNNNNNATSTRLKQSKSRELRGSVMYVGCDCERRNGLQDDCQRTECHGSPGCLTLPYPTCGPSKFSQGKHLGKPYAATGGHGTVTGGSFGGALPGTKLENSGNDVGDEYEYQCFPASRVENNETLANCSCNCEEMGNCDPCCGYQNQKPIDTVYTNEEENGQEYASPDDASLVTLIENKDLDQWEYAFLPSNLADLYPNINGDPCICRCLPHHNIQNPPWPYSYLPYVNICNEPTACRSPIHDKDPDEKWPCHCRICSRPMPIHHPLLLSFPCPKAGYM